MSAVAAKAIIEELRGNVCACGAKKQKRQTFCRSHYFQLPGGMREAIYQTIPEYFDAYREACEFLRLTPAGSAQPISSGETPAAVSPHGAGKP